MGNKSSVAQESVLVKTTKKIITNPDVQIVEKEAELLINASKFSAYLFNLKNKCDQFDIFNKSKTNQIDIIDSLYPQTKTDIDKFFIEIYNRYYLSELKNTNNLKKQIQQLLSNYFLEIKINQHILYRPLGYPGDYSLMNYIYNNHQNYCGKTTFQKLLHIYTTSSLMIQSNIDRLDYFINKITSLSKTNPKFKVASIGCGPAREILQSIKSLTSNAEFHLVDFESKALSFFKKKLRTLDKPNNIKIDFCYHLKDIKSILKGDVDKSFFGFDFIYASGLYDYLSPTISKNLLNKLYSKLNNNGTLIIVNASSETECFKSYYELLGEWKLYHRSKEEMVSWTTDLVDAKITFEDIQHRGYNFLVIQKP